MANDESRLSEMTRSPPPVGCIVRDVLTGSSRALLLPQHRGQKVNINRSSIIVTDFTRFPWGSTLTMGQRAGEFLVVPRLDIDATVERLAGADASDAEATTHAKRRRLVVDDPNNQTDNKSDIGAEAETEAEADPGADANDSGGDNVADKVSRLAAGNVNYDCRTKFSKQKFVKRKLERHAQCQYELSRATPLSLCDSFCSPAFGGPGAGAVPIAGCGGSVPGVRADALGLILSRANVHFGAKVLLSDQLEGLITAGVLQRVGCPRARYQAAAISIEAAGCSAHAAEFVAPDSCTDSAPSVLVRLPLKLLLNTAATATEAEAATAATATSQESTIYFASDCMDQLLASDPCLKSITSPEDDPCASVLPTLDGVQRPKVLQKIERRIVRQTARREAWQWLRNRQLDAVIVGVSGIKYLGQNPADCEAHLAAMYDMALSSLKPGGKLVLFTHSLTPLSQILVKIKAAKHDAQSSANSCPWVEVALSELTTDEMSVATSRSRPVIHAETQPTSGFVLSATYII